MFSSRMIDLDLLKLFEEITLARTMSYNTYLAAQKGDDPVCSMQLQELQQQLAKIRSMENELRVKITQMNNG